jgi:hypothetical protein
MASANVIMVGAFITMHGDTIPKFKQKFKQTSSPTTYNYELTATALPGYVQLFAPSNLGYQYFGHMMGDETKVREIHKDYMELQPQPPNYIQYCLDKIHEFESEHVDRVSKYLDDDKRASAKSDEVKMKQRQYRLAQAEMVTLKSRVNWKQRHYRITEKMYETHANDTPFNSIMFFVPQLQLSCIDVTRIKKYREYGLTFKYDDTSRIYSIEFPHQIYWIEFDTILEILNSVLQCGLPQGSKYSLSIFDFSCSNLFFENLDELSLTPNFLSFEDGKMIYGTIAKEISTEHGRAAASLPFADAPVCFSPEMRTRAEFKCAPVHTPSRSPSPAASPNSLIVVHVDPRIQPFIDSNPQVEPCGSRSVSPGRGGRTRIRKNTHRKRITTRRRRTLRAKSSHRRSFY